MILAALLWALLRRTAVGQGMTAVGLNESGAIFAGLRTRWLKVLAFALSGLLAGVAGIMIIAQAGAASSFGLGFRPPHGAPPAPGRARCLHRQVEYDRVPRPGVRSSSEQEGAHG